MNDAKSIFLAAAEKTSAAQREEYLRQACAGNDELRRRVEALLKAHDEPDSFLEKPAVDPQQIGATVEMQSTLAESSSQIGPYKLLQQIGEGGMGVVYLAEQQEPVRRKVALKIIKPGMDSRQVIARFEAERQALAMMEHENIARVLDAGTTETGRPFFVMELVKGVPITEYCDRNQLTMRERLELFVAVCRAVQHAHQKGIIHRDIKPSNVLICLYDGRPTPKVIDFGVAKATEQRLTEKTMFTQHGQIVGTLEYMSPEQAEMNQLDVDTRSDIYSLGVLLYELLTGSTPITREQLRDAGFTEMLRLIREQEPDRPSARLSHSGDALPTISAQRKSEPKKLALLLRGELDWIVMTALEKDRTRRYATANDFARDIERHLNDEPVEACPPSPWYRMRKFARKHRKLMAAAALIGGILLVSLAIYRREAIRATAAETRAVLESQRALEAASEARQQLQESTRQKERAARAEEQAQADRDRAVQAEAIATDERNRAIGQTQEALHSLGRTLYQSARALLASDAPGRRWAALEALQGAEQLRRVTRTDLEGLQAADASGVPDADRLTALAGPGTAIPLDELQGLSGTELAKDELRTQAVAALLAPDGRVVDSWEGFLHAISPNGRFLANTWINFEDRDRGCRVIDMSSGKPVWEIRDEAAKAVIGPSLAISHDGRRIASVAFSRSLNLVEVHSGRILRTLTLPPLRVPGEEAGSEQSSAASSLPAMLRGLTFSADGRWLAAARYRAATVNLVLWDLNDPQQTEGTMVAATNGNPLLAPYFSPDSRLLAYRSDDQAITLRSLVQVADDRIVSFPWVLDNPICFTPNGSHVVVHGHDPQQWQSTMPTTPGAVLVWDLQANQEVARWMTEPTFVAVVSEVSPDGQRIAIGQLTGEIIILDTRDASQFRLDHGAMPQSLKWIEDGERLLSAGVGACKAWQLTTTTPLDVQRLEPTPPSHAVARFAVSPDLETVAVEFVGGKNVKLFEMPSRRLLRELPLNEESAFEAGWLLFGTAGRRLLRFGFEEIVIWDLQSSAEPLRFGQEIFAGRSASSAGFPDENTIFLGGVERLVPMVKEVASGDVLWQGKRERGAMAKVSADGSLVVAHSNVAGEAAKSIEIRQLPGGGLLRRIPSSAEGLGFQTLLDISPDNRWLLELHLDMPMLLTPSPHPGSSPFAPSVIGGTDQNWRATVWDVSAGERHWEIQGDSNPHSVVFSPNGRYLAVSQRDGRAILWDVDAKQRLFDWQAWQRTQDLGGVTRELAFTADSRKLVAADPSTPALRFLDLVDLNQRLGEIRLGW